MAVDDLRLILEKTPASVWQALRGQRIFITGGTGFVGCWLLEALIWANQERGLDARLTVLTRQPEAFRRKAPHLATHPAIELVQGDVNDLSGIDGRFDIVIHAATDVVKADADQLTVFDDIVNGTRQTLSLVSRCQARRYLLTSSGAVYGRQPDGMTHVAEDYPGAPDTMQSHSAYGQAKRVSEWLVQSHAERHGTATSIARCFALIGPYLPLDAQFAAGNFIGDGLCGRDIKVSGDGSAYRSYLYAADMTIWLLTILINGTTGQTYNLGSDHGLTIRELAGTVSQSIFGTNRVSCGAASMPNTPPQRYVPNVDKAKRELHLLEYTDLLSAIRKTIDWAIQMKETANRDQPGFHNV